nr:sigma-70 family RNA polymerase sigma factor [Oscillospiraceae bacterium]
MDNGESSYRRFLAGDDEGLHEIICAYRAGLILYLNSFVQNIHTAEDLTEDTFTELATKMPKYSGKSSFKTWLYAIGRNLTAKYLRKHAKLKVVPLESQEFLADEADLERNYIKSEQKQLVH